MKQAINNVVMQDVADFRNALEFTPDENSADRYQELAVRSAIYPGKGTPFGLMYCALGLGEAGEVQNKVKKAFRDDDVIGVKVNTRNSTSGIRRSVEVTHVHEITEDRKRAIIKELGGNLWYIAATCAEIGTTIGEVMATNLEEIASRSERGTLSGDGDNR